MANKSRLSFLEVTVDETSTAEGEDDSMIEVEIEEDIEVAEIVIMDSENMTIEDLEEILAIDQKAASTAAKKDTLPKTANNVINYIIQRENLGNSTEIETTIEEVIEITKEEADLEVETDTENTEREVQAAQAEVEADK